MAFLKPFLLLFQNLYFIFIGLFGLGFLIGFHELGHFIFCKLFNIHTPSFSIGFGKKIISRKIGETEFSLSAIPLGGYVEIAGSAEIGQGEQKDAQTRDERSFALKPYYQKLLVMSGGIIFNLLFSYTVLILLFMAGMPKSKFLYPKNAIPVIQEIIENSSAYKFGLKTGDTILAINGKEFSGNVIQLMKHIKTLANQKATILIERDNTKQEIELIIDEQQSPFDQTTVGSLGVIFEMTELPGYSFLESIKQGIQLTNAYIYQTFYSFASIFRKKDVSQLSGPLMIISLTVSGAAHGIKIFLILLAIISISLAVLNLLPLPILDGGQILFYTIEAIIRRPLPTRIKEYIHIGSWIGILLLMLYVSVNDIARIADPHVETLKKFIGWNK